MRLDECKLAIKECITALVADGNRKANIEIELIHFIKRELYREGE
jgi:hypothetical protein